MYTNVYISTFSKLLSVYFAGKTYVIWTLHIPWKICLHFHFIVRYLRLLSVNFARKCYAIYPSHYLFTYHPSIHMYVYLLISKHLFTYLFKCTSRCISSCRASRALDCRVNPGHTGLNQCPDRALLEIYTSY